MNGKTSIRAVFLDLGDTLVDEGSAVRNASGDVVAVEAMPDAFRLLAELRERGLRLVLVSNGRSTDARNVLKYTGLDGQFDGVLISGETGSEKPDAKMFEMALEIAGVAPGEALMVGNRASADIAGANALGIGSVWFRWNDHYRDEPEAGASEADFTIDSMSELSGLIDRLNGRG